MAPQEDQRPHRITTKENEMKMKPKMIAVAVNMACHYIGVEWRVANGLLHAG